MIALCLTRNEMDATVIEESLNDGDLLGRISGRCWVTRFQLNSCSSRLHLLSYGPSLEILFDESRDGGPAGYADSGGCNTIGAEGAVR